MWTPKSRIKSNQDPHILVYDTHHHVSFNFRLFGGVALHGIASSLMSMSSYLVLWFSQPSTRCPKLQSAILKHVRRRAAGGRNATIYEMSRLCSRQTKEFASRIDDHHHADTLSLLTKGHWRILII